jgi:hypothetical protein
MSDIKIATVVVLAALLGLTATICYRGLANGDQDDFAFVLSTVQGVHSAIQQNRESAAATSAAANKLRDTIAKLANQSVPTDLQQTVSTLGNIYQECRKEYRSLGYEAESIAEALRGLEVIYEKQLRLDTSLSNIPPTRDSSPVSAGYRTSSEVGGSFIKVCPQGWNCNPPGSQSDEATLSWLVAYFYPDLPLEVMRQMDNEDFHRLLGIPLDYVVTRNSYEMLKQTIEYQRKQQRLAGAQPQQPQAPSVAPQQPAPQARPNYPHRIPKAPVDVPPTREWVIRHEAEAPRGQDRGQEIEVSVIWGDGRSKLMKVPAETIRELEAYRQPKASGGETEVSVTILWGDGKSKVIKVPAESLREQKNLLQLAFPSPEPPSEVVVTPPSSQNNSVLLARAVSFVELHFYYWSQDNRTALQGIAPTYASSINFYGTEKSASSVMEEKRKFAERWPKRDYTFFQNETASYCASEKCFITGEVVWDTYSPGRNAASAGTAEVSFDLSVAGNSFVITNENGRVIARATSHPDPDHQAQPSQPQAGKQPPARERQIPKPSRKGRVAT